MKNKTNIIYSILLLCFVVNITIISNALFTDRIKSEVIYSTGSIDVTLNDTFPQEGVKNVVSGVVYDKELCVTNTSFFEDICVRVKYVVDITDRDGNSMPTYIKDNEGNNIDIVTFRINENSNWIYHDNYFYYPEILTPGETSDILYNELYISPLVENNYQDCKMKIFIYAEAIQAEAAQVNGTNSIISAWLDVNNLP